MKNIRLTTNPDAITSLAPPPMPGPPFQTTQPVPPKQTYSISFNAQFETEAECLSFASELLAMANKDNINA